MRKIVLFVYTGARNPGGVERYLETLFHSYPRDTLRLMLISLGDWDLTERLKHEGADVSVLSARRIRVRTILEIARKARKERADLIVSQGVVGAFYSRIAALISRTPNLVVVHSLLSNDYPKSLQRHIYLALEKMMRGLTDHYVAISVFLRDSLIEAGVHPSKVSLVYNGVSNELSDLRPSEPRADGRVVLGSLGRLHRVKNYHNLIEAMSMLDDNVHLSIWGEGEERERLQEIIRRLDLGARVRLEGWSESLASVFSSIDIYVQTSITEGYGRAVVEAMLASKPVVVTPGGSLPEVVDNGRTGILASGFSSEQIAAAIKSMLADGERATMMGKTAREDAMSRFSEEVWITQICSILRDNAR